MRLLLPLALLLAARPALAADPDFQRDVRPILARHCFKCHGPDDQARKAKLRLDQRDTALKPARSGSPAIVPGKPDDSELVRRVFSDDEGQVMPPPGAKLPLTPEQKETLRRWVAAGAPYAQHWAFLPPKQLPPPAVRLTGWPRNPIDRFVLAKLEAAGLQPAPPADRYTLIRRVSLDLIGLPPTPAEADAFVNDPRPDAYERLIDRLLASPHYGERWARKWLDLARYADTNGYEKDRQRSIWPYRDWVINALNRDLPFDQFTIEQLAGDLLPNATLEQRIATGFHRNTMLNEEGGIDPLEFRFNAMTDRVATTGTAWLGLTLGCVQCHTHKFDPIQHREYYGIFACLNNADEPELDLPTPEVTARRQELEARIAQLTADLPNRFPVGAVRWQALKPREVSTTSGHQPQILDDGSALFTEPSPAKDTYTLVLDADGGPVDRLRLEALADPKLPSGGPGRVAHGNFVLSEITVTAAPKDRPDAAEPVKLVRAEADAAQDGMPAESAIDGNPATGWAVHVAGKWNVTRTAVFTFARPVGHPGGTRFTVQLAQLHGLQHTLGRVRLSVGAAVTDGGPVEGRRRAALEKRFAEWLAAERARAVAWNVLRPVDAKANVPLLTVQDDASVFVSGDITKHDVYDLKYRTDLKGITALRLEALPDDRLPRHGPGMAYYEGPKGEFFLSELRLFADGKPVKFASATETYGKAPAATAIDGDFQTGWFTTGREGERHVAVFRLAEPLPAGQELRLEMHFGRYYAASLGRFRVAVTTAAGATARPLADDAERLLLLPDEGLTPAHRDRLRQQFLDEAPELAAARAEIAALRKQLPAYPTTLVLRERPAGYTRPTFRHHRGEFLQAKEPVDPGTPAFLPPLPLTTGEPARLAFARWLVAPENPLTARVTVNRQWAAFFGRGLVRTTEDFGYQGELPTHPELLDWLAVAFRREGWSLKRLHRMIVTSATYQQSSRVTPALKERDPDNLLLARGPRVRLEAEQLRDGTLRAAGLLTAKLGGPSVFPPQPASVTTEGTYGALNWTPSQGPDRYRRGLYTFSKRTAPFAMFSTFDAPSGEACVARRDVSNTPLQALTLLNDVAFTEAAQALGRTLAAEGGTPEERLMHLFRRILTRPPTADEVADLRAFYAAQRQRFAAKELDAGAVAGPGPGDAAERAAWTVLARLLFNLDEAIVKR